MVHPLLLLSWKIGIQLLNSIIQVLKDVGMFLYQKIAKNYAYESMYYNLYWCFTGYLTTEICSNSGQMSWR